MCKVGMICANWEWLGENLLYYLRKGKKHKMKFRTNFNHS